jgi:hypothetical protein
MPLFLCSKLFWIGRNVEDAIRDVGGGEARGCVGPEEDDTSVLGLGTPVVPYSLDIFPR